jgi:hypothetical protein
VPDDVADDDGAASISDALRELPLLDELFLGMQAMNVDLVDGYLEGWEAQLLQEYIQLERTPLESALFVSALSQMWVFAAYELLRTWRKRVREVVKWSETLRDLDGAAREAAISTKRDEIARGEEDAPLADRWQAFERAASEAAFVDALRLAFNRTEIAFRNIEAVRMTLAKHELPRQRGMAARSPGYGRIDMENGSIYWQIDLGDREIAIHSRRDLARGLRTLTQYDDRILPVEVQERLREMRLPQDFYGGHRCVVVLDGGMEVSGVWILWATIVGRVEGQLGLPFEVSQVVDVRRDETPEPQPDESLPF